MRRASRNRYFARSDGASDDQPFSNAPRAVSTARRTSSSPASATSNRVSSVEGEIEVNHSLRPRLDLLPADEEPVPLADLHDVSRLGRRRVLPLERGRDAGRALLDLGHQSIVK